MKRGKNKKGKQRMEKEKKINRKIDVPPVRKARYARDVLVSEL
jgi:hypothetical protein